MTIKEEIQKVRLSFEDDEYLQKSILFLYQYQTGFEKFIKYTTGKNFVGFNRPDAPDLSRYSEKLLNNKELSDREITDAKERMRKYSGQLYKLGFDISQFDFEEVKKRIEEAKRKAKEELERNRLTIDKLVEIFDEIQEISQYNGREIKSIDLPNETFWDLWKESKDELKNIGISIMKDFYGNWKIIQYVKYDFSIDDLLNLFETIEGKEMNTKRGLKLLKTLKDIPKGFWGLWKENKAELKELGFSPSNYKGNWSLNQWKEIEEDEIIDEDEIIEEIEEFELQYPEKLFRFQRKHTLQLIDAIRKYNTSLDASDTGTGKTYTNLSVCKELGLKVFIVCPKPVIPSWNRAIKHLEMKDQVLCLVNYELIKTGKYVIKRAKKRGVGFIKENVDCPYLEVTPNPKSKEKWQPKNIMRWNLPKDSVIIFDEAHRCKNRNTQNTQLMLQAKDQNCKIMMLSATIGENPLKLDAIGYSLGLHQSKWDFFNWIKDFGCRKEVVNSYGQEAWIFNGDKKNIKKLNDLIFPEKGSRMRISEIPEFPKTQIEPVLLDMNSNGRKLQKIYKDMEKELKELKKREEEMEVSIQGQHLKERQKDIQKVELLKVPSIVEMTEDYIESGNSVAIFVNHTQTVESLAEKLGTNCTFYGSDYKASERNEQNRIKFQKGESRVIICNIKSAKEGIDLHDEYHNYPRISLINPNDSAQYLKQVLGRVHRAGGTKSIQRIIFCEGTIEEDVYENVKNKLKNIKILNDGNLDNFDITDEDLKKLKL
ncbi:MAG: helicase-related protein [Candidatus Thorarchaeota archaeon]